jgi:hypothetical protein
MISGAVRGGTCLVSAGGLHRGLLASKQPLPLLPGHGPELEGRPAVGALGHYIVVTVRLNSSLPIPVGSSANG